MLGLLNEIVVLGSSVYSFKEDITKFESHSEVVREGKRDVRTSKKLLFQSAVCLKLHLLLLHHTFRYYISVTVLFLFICYYKIYYMIKLKTFYLIRKKEKNSRKVFLLFRDRGPTV